MWNGFTCKISVRIRTGTLRGTAPYSSSPDRPEYSRAYPSWKTVSINILLFSLPRCFWPEKLRLYYKKGGEKIISKID